MIIDCTRCTMRDIACGDCVVSHFLANPEQAPLQEVVGAEHRALRVLHGAGLVPPLRMVDSGRARAAGS